MSTVFLKILNISLTAGWLILAVIILRLLLKKAPKWISCLLWALVAVRLLLPFSIESVLSLVPSSEVVPTNIVYEQKPVIDSGIRVVNNAVNPVITETFAPAIGDSVNPLQIAVSIASVVWIAGIAGMLIYALISFLLLKKRVLASVPLKHDGEKSRRILLCDEIKSPFILGVFKPSIYIPSSLDDETRQFVIAHETAHLKRRDNLWKPLGFLLLSVYWFHPLCWVAYILLCRDIESACDERVIKDKDKDYLALYSQALLDCALQRKRISACPLAFGETGVKSRVKGILNYKKPAFWIIIAALVCIAVVTVCFLTNPKKKEITAAPSQSEIANEEIPSEKFLQEGENKTDLGDIDRDGTDEYIIAQSVEENDNYKFLWDLYFDGEIIYHGENVLPCHFDEAWYIDLDEDGKEEIFIPFYPEVNSMPQTQYVALKKSGASWKELENTDVGYESDNYTNAFPLHVTRGKSTGDVKNVEENSGIYVHITCDGYEQFVGYDIKEHYTKLYNSEDGILKSVANDILYTDKYSQPGTDLGGPAAWGVWEIKRGTFDGKDCIIATHGIEGLGGKFDIFGTADVYFNYDKNGKIRVLNLSFSPSEDSDSDMVQVSNWLSAIELPNGYSFSQYDADGGYGGSFLILPQSYNGEENGETPLEWLFSGMLTKYPAANTKVTYTNGIPNLSGVMIPNHTVEKYLEVIGLERSNMQWPAIMLEENHSLYTAPQIEQMKQNGIDTSKIDLTSEYWYFWFVKEGENTYYVLSLSKKEFSKEEAIKIAKTVSINE